MLHFISQYFWVCTIWNYLLHFSICSFTFLVAVLKHLSLQWAKRVNYLDMKGNKNPIGCVFNSLSTVLDVHGLFLLCFSSPKFFRSFFESLTIASHDICIYSTWLMPVAGLKEEKQVFVPLCIPIFSIQEIDYTWFILDIICASSAPGIILIYLFKWLWLCIFSADILLLF